MLRSIVTRLDQLFRLRERATFRYLQKCGYRVQGGPFQGLHYIDAAHCSALAPKIAGAYERELHPYFERMVALRPDCLVDVGAAEGYYAVGAAVKGWSPRIIAFESEPDSRAALRALMGLNQVDATRIDVRELCTPAALENALAGSRRPAVIVDAEGFEALLLDPLRVPSLRRAVILLEYHDFILPGLHEVIIERMAETHGVQKILPLPRQAEELIGADPFLKRFPVLCRALLSEFRPPSRHGWLWFEPKATSA